MVSEYTCQSEEDWPFDQAPNVAAISSRQVIELDYPILLVTHYEDDHSWAFLCGTTESSADGRVIGMGNALNRDPTLRQIADLPPGWSARRKDNDSEWVKYPETTE
jgi:hypothetical protein